MIFLFYFQVSNPDCKNTISESTTRCHNDKYLSFVFRINNTIRINYSDAQAVPQIHFGSFRAFYPSASVLSHLNKYKYMQYSSISISIKS